MEAKIEGLKELDRKLGQLRDDLASRALKSAVRAGASVMLREIQARVPEGRGNFVFSKRRGWFRRKMRDDIRLSTKFEGLTATATIAPRKFAFIVNWLERTGAQPHKIRARKKQFLNVPGIGFVRSVQHPGFKPRPFIVPAFEASWQRALEAFKTTLASSIERFSR